MSAISYLIDVIRHKQNERKLGEEIFFRGQRENYGLVPSLLRKKWDNISKIENNIYCDAWVMGAAELSSARNSWEVLATFQHYEIPTRLLDWSSSIPNALFFALLKCLKCKSADNCQNLRKSCDGNPVLWVLDPGKMHEYLYPDDPIAKEVALTVGVDTDMPDYLKEFVKKDASNNNWPYKNGPVFIEIPWSNPRIRSQKGFFTFHNDARPLDKLLDDNTGLIKIIISEENRKDVVAEFNALGTNEHDIFTDLVSLANYFKRHYAT
jgi:hypothetical protein